MNTVVCLARMPVPGKPTPRAAGTDSPRDFQLERIQRCRDLLDRIPPNCEVEVSLAEPFDFVMAQSLFGHRPFFSQQADGDLGQRLCVAAIRAFQSGAQKTVLIGAECPALTPEHLSNAFRILDSHTVALCPTSSGGFCLLGMTRIVPELFAITERTGGSAYADLLARLRVAKISFGELPMLPDEQAHHEL